MQISIDRKKMYRGLLLLLLSLFFLKLSVSGGIHMLVSDLIATVVTITTIPLILLSLAILFWSLTIKRPQQLRNQHQHEHQHEYGEGCECGHTHLPSSSFWGKATVCLLLLSLLAAYGWHPKALGSEMIASTPSAPAPQFASSAYTGDATTNATDPADPSGGLTPPSTNTQNTDAVVAKQSAAEESQATFAIQYQADPKKYMGKQISLEGFVYHSPMLPPNYFILTRYFVFCCIADAYPIGITVRSPDSTTLKNDTWVQVTGTIDTKPLPVLDQIEPTNWFPSSPQKPVIDSVTIKPIPTPTKPYMMPR